MVILLVGLLIIAVPIALALRTWLRVTRRLGGVDAVQIGAWIAANPAEDLAPLACALHREWPGSLAEQLVTAVVTEHGSPLGRQLALAEAVADVERDVVDDVRVPRIAASLATTSGLFAAAIVMREGLAAQWEGGGEDVAGQFQAVIERGLTLVALAIFGGLCCAALHRSAQRQRRTRLEELDALGRPLAERLGIDPP